MNEAIYRIRKRIKEANHRKALPRIIIEPDLCFPEEEYRLRINGLTRKSMKAIRANFSSIVDKVVSISARGREIYVECIGTAGEHFVTTLKIGG